jgi:L-seryl-tRNA(Ser) seleniumtransferase
VTLAALEAVLKLYADPERLTQRLPSLRLLSRAQVDIAADAEQVMTALQPPLANLAQVKVVACSSQIGSGALPVETLSSAGVAITPLDESGATLKRIADAFRALPVPVIGHVKNGALVFDLRCLEDVPAFTEQIRLLSL